MIDAGKNFQSVQKHGRGAAERARSLTGHDMSVRKNHGGSGSARLLGLLQSSGHGRENFRRGFGLIHDELQMIDFLLIGGTAHVLDAGSVVAAQNFHAACFAADIIVNDAVACHIHPHVCRRLIGRDALNSLKDGV